MYGPMPVLMTTTRSDHFGQGYLDETLLDRIPGSHASRMSLLGEVNWIFTAVTDTIAWCSLPVDLFQRLFRQDLLVASLMRNFMLAERVMKAYGCQPQSAPVLPCTHRHYMW
ncbi:unnamed protein product [Protopolystoma xenopodis]|uniref:Uncharacterized protein n=1 Tax=Protopolystoma xenopodis TaxID=117903 RepID=A0A3S5B0U3_9PLAT|nr:unnamed protein product [Protopolystoma xenopodis]